MYILPKNDREVDSLCDMARYKGRHDVIMEVKTYMEENNYKITYDAFLGMIKHHNKKGWPSWC